MLFSLYLPLSLAILKLRHVFLVAYLCVLTILHFDHCLPNNRHILPLLLILVHYMNYLYFITFNQLLYVNVSFMYLELKAH